MGTTNITSLERQTNRAPKRPARAAAPRAAWITDPQSLLSALEDAEARERALLEPPPAPKPVPVMSALLEEAEADEAHDEALPALREDERIGHASSAGVVVIIRRRRAA